MRGLELALGEVHHVHHVGRKTEAVAKLLDGDSGADSPEVLGQLRAQIDEREAGQRHAGSHPPERFLPDEAD